MSLTTNTEFQFLIWGYAIAGDVTEQDALIAEGTPPNSVLWDRTRRSMSGSFIDRRNGFEPVPDWWALHYLPMSWREQALDQFHAA